MWFWWIMLFCDILIPLTMIIGGLIIWKRCPKKINSLFGYRSPLAMKNMDTWNFAHNHCGRLWWKVGLITLLPSALVHIPFYNSNEDTIGALSLTLMVIQCVILVASIIPTERALKKVFNADGTRK